MKTALLWFRRDLRLGDNPALAHGLANYERVIPVYVHAPDELGPWSPGAASRWWLHHSLASLDGALRERGSRLLIRSGQTLATLRALVQETGAEAMLWNRLYTPEEMTRDRTIKAALQEEGLEAHSFNAALLNEPWCVTKPDGEPYKVFTPYWKACLKRPQASPQPLTRDAFGPAMSLTGVALEALRLLPTRPWDARFYDEWQPGETGAQAVLQDFLEDGLRGYVDGRDRPDQPGTSRLSPHLAFGEIGPRQIVAAIERHAASQARDGVLSGAQSYVRELYWREFAHQLLYHFPATPDTALDERFAAFPWRSDSATDLARWQRGQTGFPIVDAGMRELWATGWMHNRVRMIVASLLTKNLLVPWQDGARWFWDTLVDADLANNTLGWQWVAGCGADAAPYFRIFSPILQGEKFDPHGDYVKRWVPELAKMPARYLHKPWQAPREIRALAPLYPEPMTDLADSRERALAAFARIKTR